MQEDQNPTNENLTGNGEDEKEERPLDYTIMSQIQIIKRINRDDDQALEELRRRNLEDKEIYQEDKP